jgi:cysteine synthase A
VNKIYELNHLVGGTPLVKISEKIYAKLEALNPSGSVKDRMIAYIVRKAKIWGTIKDDTILCEATSGNTGISLAMTAARLGLRCMIFMPRNMSEERKQMMRVYGADIIDAPDNDFVAAIAMRDAFLGANNKAWSPKQFSNPYNIECHERVTAPEIHKQVISVNRRWCAFIHGSGTGGTIEGMRRYIEKNQLNVQTCLVRPSESPHGIQGIADGREFLAPIANMDHIIDIGTEEAIERAKRFAAETGLLVGISSGANILAAEKYVEDCDPRGIVVTILCDRGERYMSVFGE